MTLPPTLVFIGPLSAEQQHWADEAMAADTAAAVFEPMAIVLQRREAQLTTAFGEAAVRFQTGDPLAWPTAARATAHARALAWLSAADPAGCWDCLLAAEPCQRHRRLGSNRTGSNTRVYEQNRLLEPEWRRFGSDAS